jgi:hypothetical protein
VVVPPEGRAPGFIPVKLLELDAASAPPRSDVAAKPARPTRRGREARRDGDQPAERRQGIARRYVDAEALRRVLLALGVA